jgi:hypothetical protein
MLPVILRHALLVKSNGINKLVVVVNKMDDCELLYEAFGSRYGPSGCLCRTATVAWDKTRFVVLYKPFR